MKKIYLLLAIGFVLNCANFTFAQPNNVNLPNVVQNLLNQNYPKWKVVNNTCSTAISGDFNSDKIDDYIVLITSKKGGNVVASISNNQDFRLISVKSLDTRDIELSAVKTALTGAKIVDSGGFTLSTCGFDDEFAYIFKNGEFVSINQDLGENNTDFNDDEEGETFIVKGSKPWLNTGIDVRKGCIVVLRPKGKVDVNAGWGTHDAFGTEKFFNAENYPVKSKFRYGLAAQITNSRFFSELNRDAWAYEYEGTHIANQSGRLWLVVNDDNPQDNLGEFQVRVRLICND